MFMASSRFIDLCCLAWLVEAIFPHALALTSFTNLTAGILLQCIARGLHWSGEQVHTAHPEETRRTNKNCPSPTIQVQSFQRMLFCCQTSCGNQNLILFVQEFPFSANKGLPLPLGRRVCETKSKNGCSRPRKPFVSRVFCAQSGIETMVSEGARPWGRGRSGDCDFRSLPSCSFSVFSPFFGPKP